jgi:hypothetical protein
MRLNNLERHSDNDGQDNIARFMQEAFGGQSNWGSNASHIESLKFWVP